MMLPYGTMGMLPWKQNDVAVEVGMVLPWRTMTMLSRRQDCVAMEDSNGGVVTEV